MTKKRMLAALAWALVALLTASTAVVVLSYDPVVAGEGDSEGGGGSGGDGSSGAADSSTGY